MVETLLEHNYKVQYIGVVPTPSVQQIVKLHNAAGGVILTASHNPGDWCGLKYVSASSIFLTPGECDVVYGDLRDEAALPPRDLAEVSSPGLELVDNQAALAEHIDCILGSDLVDAGRIREAGLVVAFNAQNASGAAYLDLLQARTGVEILRYNTEVGRLPARPEPTPANLQDFKRHLAGKRFDLGFAVDPDADRCVLVDETGEPVLEELTLVMCNDYVQGRAPQRHFVKNCSSSMANDVVCRRHGCEVVETAVGEVNVCMKLRELGALLGGEGNGGVIFSGAHLGRDSLVAVLLVLSYYAEEKLKNKSVRMSQLVGMMPKFEIVKEKYDFRPEDRPKLLQKLEGIKTLDSRSRVLTVDGVKLIYDKDEKWVHVRFSNTEPIMRIIAEAHSADECRQLIKMVEQHMF